MHFFWKALLWLSNRPQAAQKFFSIPAGIAMLPMIYVVLLFLLQKSVEESIVKAIEVQVPTWYWYVLIGVCSAWVTWWFTKLFHEIERSTLQRKAAGMTVTLAHRRVRDENNRHATPIYGHIEPRKAIAIDLVATLYIAQHLRNVTRARVIITDARGSMVVNSEIVNELRGNVNQTDTAEIAIMTVIRPQDVVTRGSNGEGPYKLVGEPEMLALPDILNDFDPIRGEAEYKIRIELLHAGGMERADFTVDLSLDVLHPIKLRGLSPLVQTERSPPAGRNDLFAVF